MSDASLVEASRWRRRYLALGLAALATALTSAIAGWPANAATSGALILAAGLAFLLAAPRTRQAGDIRPLTPVSHHAALLAASRELLDCLDDPVLILDNAGRIVFANRASASIVGADAERKHISAVLRTPQVLEVIERILAGGEAELVSFTMPVPLERHFQVHISQALPGSLAAPMLLVQIRDLTALRRTEELRADFVANASHELRTPLAALTGFIDTLRGHAKDDPEARERFLGIMSVEAGRMRRLIDDLLSLTRIELNEHNPPQGEVDIVEIVRSAATALAPLADAEGIAITIAPQKAIRVAGERDELTQVFQNLLHNAIKYGRQGSQVRVEFGEEEAEGKRAGQAFVSVADEGEGIPREAIPRLTERFYRVDVKRSRERGGTGLGLAIVKHILNRHHGRLHIESTPGQGSIFTVYLPLAVSAAV